VEHCTVVRPKNLEGIIREYGASGFTIVGTSATVGIAPSKINFTAPVIIVLGGEHRGIPPYLEKLCTCFATISISNQVQSLNVSAAGAIILYECSRQREQQ
jgi:23S rRNA (guanosine2251-2'-O)-methyltransferase